MNILVKLKGLQKSKQGFSKKIFLLYFLFLFGFIIGIVCVGFSADKQELAIYEILDNSFESYKSSGFLDGFFNSFLSILFYIIASYMLGLFAYGTPIIYALPIFLGVQKGIIISFLFIQNGLIGVLKTIFLFVPQNAFIVSGLFFTFLFSIDMSIQTFFTVRGISRFDVEYLDYFKYNKYFLIFLAGALVLSAIDSFMVKLI